MVTTKKKIIIIAGPTAVGKTTIALKIAKHFNTKIISADSRQCYKELNIGVAKPSVKELAEVKHYFINSHSIHEKVGAADFEKYAIGKANEIFEKNDFAVMVGGTGLYIKAFCEGLDEIPAVPEIIREEIITTYNQKGLAWLQNEVHQSDPEFYKTGEIKNPHRLIRALEVFKSTGRSILDFRKNKKAKRDFNFLKIALDLPKEQLHKNINDRVDKMIEDGLLEEARSLIPYQHLNALQTVGYKELFSHFIGEMNLTEAIEAIKKNTRQYARRQLTWFKKDKEYEWVLPGKEEIMKLIDQNL